MLSAVNVWGAFGFIDTPYRIDPLRPTKDDYALFVGRRDRGIEFRTQIEGNHGCVSVVSGNVGVGKTSFFNAQQYLLFSGLSEDGPRVLPALVLTSVESDDDATTLARRVTYNSIQSLKAICASEGVSTPKVVGELDAWLSHERIRTGRGASVSVLGFEIGGEEQFYLPPVDSTTLEQWRDILRKLSAEICATFRDRGFQGFFVAIDNLESVTTEKLARILMTYRDSLFDVDHIWWVLIGPPGLHGLLETTDIRVAQVIQGGGIDIEPLSAEELHEAIDRRIQRFRANDAAVSPIPYRAHDVLYKASHGELRFVLQISDQIVREVITKIRIQAQDEASRVSARGRQTQSGGYLSAVISDRAGQTLYSEVFRRILSNKLFEGRLHDDVVIETLRSIVAKRLTDLRASDLALLAKIGDREVTDLQAPAFGFADESQFAIALERLVPGYLHRRLVMQKKHYSANGVALLARWFHLY